MSAWFRFCICSFEGTMNEYSSLAQSVEHAAVNRSVVGSSPTGGAFLFPVNVKFTGFLHISYLKNRDKFSDKNSGQDNNYKKRVDINNKHLYLHVF